MKILIIGGCGYIGSRLFDWFSSDNEVKSIDIEWYGNPGIKNTKLDYGKLSEEDIQDYEVIISLAGYSSERMCKGILPDVLSNNVINLFRLSTLLNKDQKLIFSSSCRSSATSFEPYDISMYLREFVFNSCKAKCYGLRLGTVNGYSMNFRRESMINSLVDSYKQRGFCEISNGNNERSILDMQDLVRAFDIIVRSDKKSELYNICSFNSTVRYIGKETANILGCELIDSGDSQKAYDFSMNSAKFCNDFNFTFHGSIDNIVHEILDNYDKMIFTNRIDPIRYV